MGFSTHDVIVWERGAVETARFARGSAAGCSQSKDLRSGDTYGLWVDLVRDRARVHVWERGDLTLGARPAPVGVPTGGTRGRAR